MKQVPIAIVGVSALFPGSTDNHGFWRDILAGRDLIRDVPPTHWRIDDYYDADPTRPDHTYCKRGAFLGDIPFDPMEFGVPPSIVPATDTSQLLALIVAQRVLEDACGGSFANMDRERASVILGVTSGQELMGSMVGRLQHPVWLKALRESGIPETEAQAIVARISAHYTPWQEATFPGLLGNVVAGRIANRFDLRGTNCVTDAACASAFSALSMAVHELALEESDIVIAGGVDTMNDIFMFMCFSKTPALSPTGDCRPFSDAADGTILGEGLCMFALKRLSDAERDNDRVYAVIHAVGSSSDGRAKSVYAPVSEGQARALRRTYSIAGYSSDTVELVEAHGTATKAGDVAEFEGLSLAFGRPESGTPWCALGSVKSQIGHTKSTAGAAGLFKAVMALHHKILPPTLKVDKPNSKIAIDGSAFYLNTRARPWIRGPEHPRRAGVSSFGFGGSNFHVAVEEYTGSAPHAWTLPARPTELVLLSAPSPDALLARIETLRSTLASRALHHVARECAAAFDAHAPERLCVVAKDTAELISRLGAVSDRVGTSAFSTPDGTHYARGAAIGPVGFVFPGQGSQYVDMGAGLAMHSALARGVWDESAAIRFDGEHLHDVVFPQPVFDDAARDAQAEKVTRTEWAQPALGAVSLAQLAVLDAVGVKPVALAGHSFGELVALHAAGAIDRETLLKMARKRGELMRDAQSVPGAMSAVSKPIETVRNWIETSGASVVVANHNHPAQVVVAGAVDAIERFEAFVEKQGSNAKRLPVSAAFHSPLVAPAVEDFRGFVGGVTMSAPTLPVIATATAAEYPKDVAAAREQLATQLALPVRFVEQVEALWNRGVRVFVEVGAGSVLSDLVGRILGDRPHVAIALDRKGRDAWTAAMDGLARLAAAGVALKLDALWDGVAPEPPAKKKPAMTLELNGSNYAKPYPRPEHTDHYPPPNPAREPVVEVREVRVEVPVEVPVAVPGYGGADATWSQSLVEMQRQAADTHSSYLRFMAETHQTFLRMTEASFGGAPMSLPEVFHAPVAPTTSLPTPVVARPVAQAPVAQPRIEVTAPVAVAKPAPAPAPVAKPAPAPTVDLESVMLRVVSDKTGYPVEMLGLSMELESDLGIDSIKRVEILSAFREAAPGMPEVQPTALAKLKTLGEIVDFMRAQSPSAPAASPAPSVSNAAPANAPATTDLEAVMLRVVSDKTGYPVEMLGLSMELESDLGIDSIKRVEILSAFREAAPGMPEVQPTALAKLKTLGEIVDFMRSSAGGPAKTSAPVTAVASKQAPAGLTRDAIVLEAVAAPGLRTSGIGRDQLAVLSRDASLAQAVVAELARANVNARAVTSVEPGTRQLLDLTPLSSATETPRDAHLRAFQHARALAGETPTVYVVVHSTKDAWRAGFAGLARTAAHEWPEAVVRSIAVAPGAETAERIARELLEGGNTLDVTLDADGTRRSSVWQPREVTVGGALPGANDVIVVTGGARGVTAACVLELARKTKTRFVLLGRASVDDEPAALRSATNEAALKKSLMGEAQRAGETLTPAQIGERAARVLASREARATLDAIRGTGASVEYVAVDVQDAGAVRAALEGARAKWGAITGVVHGAGVLADKAIAAKTDAQFQRVFDTKVGGLEALLDATERDALRWLVLFSSVASRTGNAGQCDYAMANGVLDAVAAAEQARRGSACRVASLGWGPWASGMVTPALKTHFEQQGVGLIDLEEGARAFVAEMGAPAGETGFVIAAKGGAGSFVQPRRGDAGEVVVNQTSLPTLVDHSIAGVPVVPVAMAVAWMLGTARDSAGGGASLAHVKVLRGIRVPNFTNGGERLRVHQPSDVRVELRGSQGAVHYGADVAARAKVEGVPVAAVGSAWLGDVYDGTMLFHGDAFRVVDAVQSVSREGLDATFNATRAGGAWSVDPVVLDGALQCAVLWSRDVLGGASLPMAIGRVDVLGPTDGALRCRVVARGSSSGRAVSDVFVLRADGTAVIALRDVETVLRPDVPASA